MKNSVLFATLALTLGSTAHAASLDYTCKLPAVIGFKNGGQLHESIIIRGDLSAALYKGVNYTARKGFMIPLANPMKAADAQSRAALYVGMIAEQELLQVFLNASEMSVTVQRNEDDMSLPSICTPGITTIDWAAIEAATAKAADEAAPATEIPEQDVAAEAVAEAK